jgi:hypothetical protein
MFTLLMPYSFNPSKHCPIFAGNRMPEKMSLDEHLSAQTKQPCIATVEVINDSPEFVKVTPWVRGGGCLCSMALRLPKSAIASVSPTGDAHYCCGKALRVVAVEFKEKSTIGLSDLFGQIMHSAQGDHLEAQQIQGVPVHPFPQGR